MPYSAWDETHLHQLPRPFDVVHDTDSSWSDRNYFFAHAPGGDLLIAAGFGIYPNTGKGSGYIKVALADGRHWDFAVGRPVSSADRTLLGAGVLRMTCVEPLKKWRIECLPNDSGIEFDLYYTPRAPMWELIPINFGNAAGERLVDQYHMKEPGEWTGWAQIDGERISVDGWHGGRDRTFGVRVADGLDFWLWLDAGFDDFAIEAWVFEDAEENVYYVDGGIVRTDGAVSKRFVKLEHETEFDGDRKRPTAATLVFTDEDGKTYRVTAESTHKHVNLNYGHPLRSELKYTDHGEGSFTAWYAWDSSNREQLVAVEGKTLSIDQLMKFELDGETGWGVFELLMGGASYPRYANWQPMDMSEFKQS